MKLILLIPAAGLLLSGAVSLDKTSRSVPSARQDTVPQPTAAGQASKMWTDNAALYKGESLTLYFDMPHAQYLGVIDPDGHFFYVVFPAESSSGKLKPLVNSERFVRLNTLTINTATFKADPYTYGVLENKKVFAKSGTYRFLLGDNLHVDDEQFLTVLKIVYRHKSRPAQKVVAYVGI